MKIYVNARFLTQPISGVQRYAIECSLQIKKTCPETVFVAPKNIIHTDLAARLGVQVVGSNTGHYWEQVDLPMHLYKQGAPALLSMANTAPLMYKNNFTTIHDLAFYHHPEWNSKLFSIWYNILMPRLAHKAKHVFTVSQTIKKELIDCYKLSAGKISVTYNGVSEIMLSDHAPVNKERIILSVGSFNKRKNHHNLIEAFLRSDLKNNYKLVIVGDKHKVFSETGLDEAILSKGNIEIREGLTDEGLVDLYQRAEAVASLSLYEGFGIPLLEGIYYGCGIICSDIPVYKELYTGFAAFCDPMNIDDIANTLDKVELMPTSLDVAALLEKYNYARSAQTIIDVLQGTK